MFGEDPIHEALEVCEGDDHPFGFTAASGSEEDVEGIVAGDGVGQGSVGVWVGLGPEIDLCWGEGDGGSGGSGDPGDARGGNGTIDGHIRAPAFDDAEEGDEHFGFFVAVNGDWRTVIAEFRLEARGERVGAGEEFAVGEGAVVASVGEMLWVKSSPLVDLVEQRHWLKALVDEGGSGEVATAIEGDESRDDREIVEGKKRALRSWVGL